jgi:hypothetical protein
MHAPLAWSQFAGSSMRHQEFIAAEAYLCGNGLISDGRSTSLGDRCMEEFGGSVLRCMRHHRQIQDQKGSAMVTSKYDFNNTHFHGSTQVGDRNTQLNSEAAPKAGGALAITVEDLSTLLIALGDYEGDEVMSVAAEVFKLQQYAAKNAGELPTEKVAEATHSGLWDRIREVLGDVAGSAISGVLKSLLGVG